MYHLDATYSAVVSRENSTPTEGIGKHECCHAGQQVSSSQLCKQSVSRGDPFWKVNKGLTGREVLDSRGSGDKKKNTMQSRADQRATCTQLHQASQKPKAGQRKSIDPANAEQIWPRPPMVDLIDSVDGQENMILLETMIRARSRLSVACLGAEAKKDACTFNKL